MSYMPILLKLVRCRWCNAQYLDVDWMLCRREGFCSAKCKKASEKISPSEENT